MDSFFQQKSFSDIIFDYVPAYVPVRNNGVQEFQKKAEQRYVYVILSVSLSFR